jgi:hypothetical protein
MQKNRHQKSHAWAPLTAMWRIQKMYLLAIAER